MARRTQYSFQKRQREEAKRKKQQEKRERRARRDGDKSKDAESPVEREDDTASNDKPDSE